MKRNMVKRQMKKVTLKFWNNMIVLSVLMLFFISSVSAAGTALSDQDAVISSDDDQYYNVRATLTDAAAVKAYNAISLVAPKAIIKSVNLLSSISNVDYEIESTYAVSTNSGLITVSVTSQVNAVTGRVNMVNKRILQSGEEVTEEEGKLLVVSNGELTTISVSDSENAQKMLVNAVELLVEKETIERPVLSSAKEFVVMVKEAPDFSYERKLASSEKYKFYVVKTSDLTTLSNRNSIVKISEVEEAHLKKFVEYSKEILSAESKEKIRDLKLKKTTLDCLEPTELKVYLEEDGWDTQSGQSSPYQQFVTPGNSVVQGLSNGKTVQEIYEMAVGWTWVSDDILNGKTEKWLLPAEFLSGTPSYSTNPSYGNVASDCSEQANTLVSLLRASSVAAEDVRVVLGKVDFDGNVGGHAWVELKDDRRWKVLDVTCGPYYDEENKEVIERSGVSDDYWNYHPYPVEEVWCYYNDVYFTDENEDVADGWSSRYDAEENFLAGFAGLLSEVSFDPMFVYIAMTIATIIPVVSLVMLKKKDSGK